MGDGGGLGGGRGKERKPAHRSSFNIATGSCVKPLDLPAASAHAIERRCHDKGAADPRTHRDPSMKRIGGQHAQTTPTTCQAFAARPTPSKACRTDKSDRLPDGEHSTPQWPQISPVARPHSRAWQHHAKPLRALLRASWRVCRRFWRCAHPAPSVRIRPVVPLGPVGHVRQVEGASCNFSGMEKASRPHRVRPYGFGGYVDLARPCERTVRRLHLLEERPVAQRLEAWMLQVGREVENAARAVRERHVYVEPFAGPRRYRMLESLHGRPLLVKSANLRRVKVTHRQ